jgi:hypothetical protein
MKERNLVRTALASTNNLETLSRLLQNQQTPPQSQFQVPRPPPAEAESQQQPRIATPIPQYPSGYQRIARMQVVDSPFLRQNELDRLEHAMVQSLNNQQQVDVNNNDEHVEDNNNNNVDDDEDANYQPSPVLRQNELDRLENNMVQSINNQQQVDADNNNDDDDEDAFRTPTRMSLQVSKDLDHADLLCQLEEIHNQQLQKTRIELMDSDDSLDIVNEVVIDDVSPYKRQRLDLGEGHLDNTSQDVIETFDGDRCD